MTGPDPHQPIDLTPREQEVLALVAEGRTNREIGAALFISESTAGVHVSNILAKLGVSSRTEAAAMAIRAGLVDTSTAPVADVEVDADPVYLQAPAAPEPTGWRARLQAQMRRHPRSTAVAGVTVVVLAAITTGLAIAVLSGERPTGAEAASPSPTARLAATASPTATAAFNTPTPTPSSSATPSASASASASTDATPSPAPVATTAPIAAPTPSPNATWTTAGGGVEGRSGHTATLLPDDSVLIAGGSLISEGGCTATVMRYHPSSDQWTSGSMTYRRCGHTASLLPGGNVLVAGGNSGTNSTAAELHDPASGPWGVTAALSSSRTGHTATLLPDGRVLIVGGQLEGDPTQPIASAEIFDATAPSSTVISGPVEPRIYHTATRLEDGSVLVAGGVTVGDNRLASAELYDPASGTWSSVAPMVHGRLLAAAVLLPDGRVLMAGGLGDDGGAIGSDEAEIYDPIADEWTSTGPMVEGRVLPTLTVLPSGRVIAWGGHVGHGQPSESTAELFDPVAGSWRFDGSLPFYLSGHTATLLDDGTILIVGSRGNTGPLMGTIRYIPLDER